MEAKEMLAALCELMTVGASVLSVPVIVMCDDSPDCLAGMALVGLAVLGALTTVALQIRIR